MLYMLGLAFTTAEASVSPQTVSQELCALYRCTFCTE